MQSNPPKDNEKYHWTQHVGRKMIHYGLSSSRVLRVIRAPERAEEGVAPGTVAVMQTAGSKAKPWEVWVMYREEIKKKTKDLLHPNKKVIITAWRYPGVSPVREKIPIPSEIVAELERENLI
ncbi:MAG: hypothetical protein KW806_03130 [Candidatus Yanofskybacteria bacterium]|nr:hypothetical protein [Candidatus Yanofskybacteria bacterium]